MAEKIENVYLVFEEFVADDTVFNELISIVTMLKTSYFITIILLQILKISCYIFS